MMPRSKSLVDRQAAAVSAFVGDLRTLKQHAGLTFSAMATRVSYSRSALAKVVNGQRPSSWPVVRAYVRACGGNEAEWQSRWRALASRRRTRHAASRARTAPPRPGPPDPAALRSVEEYLAALRELRALAGLSYRRLSELTGGYGERVAPTTLFDALHADRLPAERMLLGYLRACGVIDGWAVAAWRAAYSRVSALSAISTMPALSAIRRVSATSVMPPLWLDVLPPVSSGYLSPLVPTLGIAWPGSGCWLCSPSSWSSLSASRPASPWSDSTPPDTRRVMMSSPAYSPIMDVILVDAPGSLAAARADFARAAHLLAALARRVADAGDDATAEDLEPLEDQAWTLVRSLTFAIGRISGVQNARAFVLSTAGAAGQAGRPLPDAA